MTAHAAFRRTLSMGRAPRISRSRVVQRLLAIPGAGNTVFLWTARSGDTTTSTSLDAAARTITWDADASARISAQGVMAKQTFTAASSQYGTTPDTLNLSFGNGTVDTAWSWAWLGSVNDTAANKTIFSKYNTAGAREYLIGFGTTELLTFQLWDESGAIVVGLNSSSPLATGTQMLLSGSYDGGGGATAANGMVAYLNAAVLPTGVVNNASYVAMENLAAPLEIGSVIAHTTQFMDGVDDFLLLCTGALSAAQMSAIKSLSNSAYGLKL